MREVGCPNCGSIQGLLETEGLRVAACGVCKSELERSTGRSLSLALACSASVFLLLIPANFLPFLTTSVIGVSRHSRLISSATAMWNNGWPLLAIIIGLFVVILPLVRFGALTLVLGVLQFGRRPQWLGRVFRFANALQNWAMPDVFLLGLWVAYARLAGTISVEVGAGAICFILAGAFSLLTRATLNRAEIWRLIGDDLPLHPDIALSSCLACDLVVPASQEGQPCPRCAQKIASREPDAIARATALTAAGLILYIPANIYPIATLPIGLHPTQYNVLQGVLDLAQAKLIGLALLVFTASFAIPLLKLAGLSYCLLSVVRRSSKRLVFKTRVYRVVEEIGRWSMVDPFVIACFVPVMQYNNLIYGRAEPAAPAFATVVVLTMIAARAFDPRLIWDAALRPPRFEESRLSDLPTDDAPSDPAPPRTLARETRGRWPGLVWALPIAALLIVGYLGLQAIAHQGVDIVVTFDSAADAKPGDTQVIYKGLSVGRVTKVALSPDRKHIDMTLRMDPSLKPVLLSGTQFWLVGANPSLTRSELRQGGIGGRDDRNGAGRWNAKPSFQRASQRARGDARNDRVDLPSGVRRLGSRPLRRQRLLPRSRSRQDHRRETGGAEQLPHHHLRHGPL